MSHSCIEYVRGRHLSRRACDGNPRKRARPGSQHLVRIPARQNPTWRRKKSDLAGPEGQRTFRRDHPPRPPLVPARATVCSAPSSREDGASLAALARPPPPAPSSRDVLRVPRGRDDFPPPPGPISSFRSRLLLFCAAARVKPDPSRPPVPPPTPRASPVHPARPRRVTRARARPAGRGTRPVGSVPPARSRTPPHASRRSRIASPGRTRSRRARRRR